VPLLTLGIPTSVTAAHPAQRPAGLRHQRRAAALPDLLGPAWALIASLYIGNVMLLVLNLPLVGLWVKLLRIPEAAAVRRHPDLRHGGGLRHAPERLRPAC
jgi:putative tricarboxylic transport membrane protein